MSGMIKTCVNVDGYSPANMGLLDPKTSDGRVIFFLPWQNATMAGMKSHFCWHDYTTIGN